MEEDQISSDIISVTGSLKALSLNLKFESMEKLRGYQGSHYLTLRLFDENKASRIYQIKVSIKAPSPEPVSPVFKPTN